MEEDCSENLGHIVNFDSVPAKLHSLSMMYSSWPFPK